MTKEEGPSHFHFHNAQGGAVPLLIYFEFGFDDEGEGGQPLLLSLTSVSTTHEEGPSPSFGFHFHNAQEGLYPFSFILNSVSMTKEEGFFDFCINNA